MIIEIKVSERDIKRIIDIGLKSWKSVTEEEKREYDRLVSYYGTLVLNLVVINK